jgi:hypothetical protein
MHRVKYINYICEELRKSISPIYESLFGTDREEIISSIEALKEKADNILNQIKQDEI